MLLSAALITRDEERFLDGCLKSIGAVVDEIVVVDTGSRDATVAIAARHGARVLSRPWGGDFAAARNHALGQCQGRWLLYIDADERLVLDGDLRAELGAAGDDVVAATVAFRPTLHSTRYLEHRLLRNRPDLRFAGAIHETLMPDLDRIVRDERATVARMPASIDHLGYEGDQTAKHRRDLPLLTLEAEHDPDRTYLWFQLGLVEAGLGHPEQAERHWATGVAAARSRGALTTPDLPLFAELVLLRLNQAAATGSPAGAPVGDLVDELVRTHPDDPLTAWVQANLAMAERRWSDAVSFLEALVGHRASQATHPVLAYDQRIFGPLANHALGVCWLHLGDPARAVTHLRRALADDPGNGEYRVKLDLAQARLRT